MSKPLHQYLVLLGLLLHGLTAVSQTLYVERLDGSRITGRILDKKIEALMKAASVHGLAVTIFNNHKPVYKKTFGYKRADTREQINPGSNFYGASLSKSVFAVLVMQLVEKGILDLDKPLQEYLPKAIYEYKPVTKWHDHYSDLKNDSLYHKITARMCLAHTGGFPNWRWDEPDQKLRVTFPPGSRYGYSGEGMVYLQVVLEHMLGKSLEQLMQDQIFVPLGMKMSSYTWQARFENDYCFGHRSDGRLYEKDKDNEPRAGSTLETTLDDYTLFTEAVLNNRLLRASTRNKMFSPQVRLRTVQQHGPLRFRDTTANDAIGLSYGLGWVLLQSPHGTGAFKEGHGDGFQHYSIIFPEHGTGIIILSNSDNAESIFKELLELTIADTFTPWYWENYIPYQQQRFIQAVNQ